MVQYGAVWSIVQNTNPQWDIMRSSERGLEQQGKTLSKELIAIGWKLCGEFFFFVFFLHY